MLNRGPEVPALELRMCSVHDVLHIGHLREDPIPESMRWVGVGIEALVPRDPL